MSARSQASRHETVTLRRRTDPLCSILSGMMQGGYLEHHDQVFCISGPVSRLERNFDMVTADATLLVLVQTLGDSSF